VKLCQQRVFKAFNVTFEQMYSWVPQGPGDVGPSAEGITVVTSDAQPVVVVPCRVYGSPIVSAVEGVYLALCRCQHGFFKLEITCRRVQAWMKITHTHTCCEIRLAAIEKTVELNKGRQDE
jgi:hypothetical protein